jgi:cell division protein FtsN
MSHQPSRRSNASRQNAKGGTLLGVFIGLIVGILMALAVVWYINRTPAPFRALTPSPEAPAATAKNGAPGTPAAPVNLPGKPGDAAPEKRFQFYDILPGKSEPKPDAKAPDKSAAAALPATPTGKPESKPSGPLSLQVGSFQTVKDAENMKATLALMGVEPQIQEVQVNGKQWYRVRVGPMMSFEELNRIKNELAKSGIQAVVVKPSE